MDKSTKNNKKENNVILPCGCRYNETPWLLTRIKECNYHKKREQENVHIDQKLNVLDHK